MRLDVRYSMRIFSLQEARVIVPSFSRALIHDRLPTGAIILEITLQPIVLTHSWQEFLVTHDEGSYTVHIPYHKDSAPGDALAFLKGLSHKTDKIEEIV